MLILVSEGGGNMDKKQFGEFLSQKRKERSLTTSELAELSGLSQSYISNVENGRRTKPKPETIEKLAKALDIPNRDLMMVAGYGYIDDIFEDIDNLKAKIELTVDLFEHETDSNGVRSSRRLSREEQLRRLFDVRFLLTGKETAYYNGKHLTNEERKRVITILDALFKED